MVNFGEFPDVQNMLSQEKTYRLIWKNPRIASTLGGDWFLKLDVLNIRTHVLLFPNGPEGIPNQPAFAIEGWSLLPSPAISAPSSAKPSTSKS